MLYHVLSLVVFSSFLLEGVVGEENDRFFLKEAKSVPRIGKRGSKSSPDFEKFFLKASKSVPRIGRRNENNYEGQYESNENEVYENKLKYPTWSEIAERYEYDPELFTSPELLMKLEQEAADDPSVYDWEKIRMKRDAPVKLNPTKNQKNV